ncbi:MAG: preprotein translocase subunit SecG [Pelodictyon luteolum]|jgi:preprotein translocase subunit SecG|uniref:Protein-export membrane protein SecG n=2 Tax=Pelodictyon luteolum TaxID=1100 RepID=Q3B4Y4_CHLL3|nr:preprotein translocase subunit SecG [Pelodictyon luteolum]ABB23597.1 protein translocase subunit secG [Pelodictyon luteolum DSM 273]KZK74379.1 MAG: preprotein translocase subunit SecG [Pelodictyon luteolum]
MHVFIVIMALLASLMLIGVIMLQNPKSGSGLTGGIASLGTVQTLGVRRTGDFLGRVTAVLAGVVMVFCFIAEFTLPQRSGTAEGRKSILQEEAPALPQQQPAGTVPVLPQMPAK